MKKLSTIALCVFLISCSGGSSKTADASEENKPKTIPGLAAVDVHGNFTSKGFTLKDDIGADKSTWTCDLIDGDHVYNVKIFGSAPTAIDRVDAMVTFMTADDAVKQFIGYSASVPYTGGNSSAATQWAIDHFDNGGDTTIGTVRFNLIKGNDNSRVLKLNAQ